MDTMQITDTFRIAGYSVSERGELVSNVIEAVENGDVDVLKLHSNIKNAEAIINLVTEHKSYKKHLLDEAEKAGKGYVVNNARFETKEAGVKYDYSVCNDTCIADLHRQKAELDKKIKARETFLKAIPGEGAVVTDEETGETVKIYPPNKISTTTVAVTLL